MSLQCDQRPASAEPFVHLVPPGDVIFAEAPAEPDRSTVRQRREVDQARLDIAQRDAPCLDARDGALHATDDGPDLLLARLQIPGMLVAAVGSPEREQLLLRLCHRVAVGPELL